MARARFDQVNIVARDLAATLAFYREAGVDIPEDAVWAVGGYPHHARAAGDGADLELDSRALARAYNEGFGAERGGVVIGLKLPSREDVDATYHRLVSAGRQGLQVPYDAFWGARYAIVEDPDGNPVGLMSPVDPSRRSPPPAL